MALDLIDELEKLVDALAAQSIAYALCGGLAVGVHGLPRATTDIDLLVLPADVAAILTIARGLGFDVVDRFARGTCYDEAVRWSPTGSCGPRQTRRH